MSEFVLLCHTRLSVILAEEIQIYPPIAVIKFSNHASQPGVFPGRKSNPDYHLDPNGDPLGRIQRRGIMVQSEKKVHG